MKDVVETYQGWQQEQVPAGRAVVVRTFGSAPRPEGATLLLAKDGRIAGSVSGGCVEGAAAEQIEESWADGNVRVIRFGISDEQAWDVGLACGGTVDVMVEPFVPQRIVEAAASDGGVALATLLPENSPGPEPDAHEPGIGGPPVEPIAIRDDGSIEGTTGTPEGDAQLVEFAKAQLELGTSKPVEIGDRWYFVESFPRRQRLVVIGAVQVAIPLVHIARELDYETIVIDGRAAFATEQRFPDVDRLILGWPDEVADEIGLGPADSVAVLTHDVKFDEPAILAALERGCRYVGAVGSRKTQANRRVRLLAAGVTEEDLERLRAPIGLDIGGRAPAETALAIMAEVVAVRYGASGGAMRDRASKRQPVAA